ncbi:MAG TPA: hypothetical protein VH109_00680 [Steroidobacteraceae bacterium]|jgi:hypothetical protein|nr:hypothetical protein [Steroidobacteraceae bacterium]
MLLTALQDLIGGIYDVRIAHDVYDFLVTDRARLPQAARGGSAEEELLVAESSDGSELALSLYLDPALLERLARADPLTHLHEGNVADCLTALEGVSHFLYLVWNAGHDRPVSLIELETQAEIDKYVASHVLLCRQAPGHFPFELRRMLFERARPDPRLAQPRAQLYREASRLAARFCARLEGTLARARARTDEGVADREVLAELRRFYRLSHARKRAHIERC